MTHLPTPLFQPPDYHWSPTNQRAFLEHLAIIGSVTLAAKHVGMSGRAAYDLKHRRDGAAFKLGWAAAVLIARGRLGDDLLERAIHGYDEEYVRTPPDENGEVRIRRRRIDSRLGMEYLKRLDRMADGIAENAGELQLAQIIMGDWEAFLDRLAPADGEGGVAAVACWLAGRDNRFNPLSALWEKPDEDCEVAQISDGFDEGVDAEPEAEMSPEEAAAGMSVWYCDHAQGWRTNFPPPPDFYGEEDGEFGEDGYERELSDEEAEVREAHAEAETAPLRDAGEAARRAWFGLKGDEDFTQRRGDAEKENGGESANADMAHLASSEDGESASELESPRLCASARNESEPEFADTVVECESASPIVRPPPDDPNIRVIHPRPNPYYPGSGRIPPWAERIC